MTRRAFAWSTCASCIAALIAAPDARAGDAETPARVRAAQARLSSTLPAKFRSAGVPWPPRELFLRAHKHTFVDDGSPSGAGELELWAGDGQAPLVRVARHPICASSGVLGPKRREGDGQVPEGFYAIAHLNPWSSYHLSLAVDYPNASDRIRGRALDAHARLGGDIMVHGSCVTIGCIPIEDGPIEEVFVAVRAVHGVRAVPIHIFPAPLHEAGLRALCAASGDDTLHAFWDELAVGWRAFEQSHRVPVVRVDVDGRYQITPR